MTAYYNENDQYAASWLRNLIAENLIAHGDVDERSIIEVQPDDLRGYNQCHFFAGIGGWSYALRLAGISDDESIWTGSCPCQPLSGAGQRKGHADERHLWPAFHRLIAECRPPTIFGEQVASRLGREWLAGVRADLEALGYAVGAADLCAASVGAPHIRQRLWFCAADADSQRLSTWNERGKSGATAIPSAWCEFKRVHATGDWKTWQVESVVRVFVDGIPKRMEQIRAYGNAIVPQLAAEFIKCALEADPAALKHQRGRT